MIAGGTSSALGQHGVLHPGPTATISRVLLHGQPERCQGGPCLPSVVPRFALCVKRRPAPRVRPGYCAHTRAARPSSSCVLATVVNGQARNVLAGNVVIWHRFFGWCQLSTSDENRRTSSILTVDLTRPVKTHTRPAAVPAQTAQKESQLGPIRSSDWAG